MTTDKEQEAFGLVLERHKSSASENDIRAAFQRFIETASIAAPAETTTEARRGSATPAGWTSTSTTPVKRRERDFHASQQEQAKEQEGVESEGKQGQGSEQPGRQRVR